MHHTTNTESNSTQTVDLRPLVMALRHHRWRLVVGVVIGLAGGFVGWYNVGAQFQATATLAVNQPRAASVAAVPMPVASYVALIQNHTVVTNALKDAGISGVDATTFMRHSLTVSEVVGTNLIRVTVRLPDHALTAKVAQAVALRAVELSRTLNDEEGSVLRDRLRTQTEEAAARLRAAEDGLLAFRRSSQVEIAQAEVNALVEQQGKLPQVEQDLSGATARSTTAEKELALRPSKQTFERSIDSDPALTEAARSQTNGDSRSLLGLGLKSEERNPAYDEIDREVALSRARVAQLDRERQQILNSSTQLRKTGKLSDLYAKQIELARRGADVALARKVYEDVAERYEQARSVVTSGSAQLQIVDAAVAMPGPVSWPLPLWLAIGCVIGLAVPVGVIVALVILRVSTPGLLT